MRYPACPKCYPNNKNSTYLEMRYLVRSKCYIYNIPTSSSKSNLILLTFYPILLDKSSHILISTIFFYIS